MAETDEKTTRESIRSRLKRSLRAVFDKVQGMNVAVHKNELPPYIPTEIINLESTQQFGVGRKRPLYKWVTQAGLTALKGMFEFVDKNAVRNLMLQDGTAIEKMVWTGSAYSSAGVSDLRTAGSTVDQMYPVMWNFDLYSGAGVNASTDRPFYYAWIPPGKRYNKAETLVAYGYALFNQGKITLFDNLITFPNNYWTTAVEEEDGIADGELVAFVFAPVSHDGQRGFPDEQSLVIMSNNTGARAVPHVDVKVATADILAFSNIKAIDVFVSTSGIAGANVDIKSGVFNYLHRIDMDEAVNTRIRLSEDDISTDITSILGVDITFNAGGTAPKRLQSTGGLPIFIQQVGVEANRLFVGQSIQITNTASNNGTYIIEAIGTTYIDITTSVFVTEVAGTTNIVCVSGSYGLRINNKKSYVRSDWEGMYLYNAFTDTSYQIIASEQNSLDATQQTLYFLDYDQFTTAGQYWSVKPGWIAVSGGYQTTVAFDNFFWQAGAEMWTYLNIPTGDTGIADFRYKFSAVANDRLFIFGCPDGFGYFSVKNRPNIIPSLNIIRPQKEPTGCVGINRDVFLFYKEGASRYTVISNEQAEKDDEFLEIGLTSQKAIVKINDDSVAFMSYKGPYILQGRVPQYIGNSLKTWWTKTGSLPYLSEAEIAQCRVFYNNLREQIWFSFPTYANQAESITNKVFVFDIRAFRQGIEAWWELRTGLDMSNGCLADDLHLLIGDGTQIADFNTTGTPDETCYTRVKFKLFKNPDLVKGHNNTYKMVFVRGTSADTFVTRCYFDESTSPVTITLNTDLQGAINYVKETLELEIFTANSANDVELESAVVTFVPKVR